MLPPSVDCNYLKMVLNIKEQLLFYIQFVFNNICFINNYIFFYFVDLITFLQPLCLINAIIRKSENNDY